MDSEEIIEMDELVIVGSRYSKDLKDRLLPIYEKGEPMSAEELGRLLGGTTLVVRPVDDNYFDYYAVGVRTEENLFLGFVWMYQSYALREWMEEQGLKEHNGIDKRIHKTIETLRQEGLLKHLYDFTWVMETMNQTEGLPKFNTPRSYITYMQSLGIKNLPSEDSINRKQNTFSGKFPDWEFSDCDMTEATRRINIGKRFLSIFRSI